MPPSIAIASPSYKGTDGGAGDSFSQTPFSLTLIEIGESLVSLAVQGAILGAMRK